MITFPATAVFLLSLSLSTHADLMLYTFSGTITGVYYRYALYEEITNGKAEKSTINSSTTFAFNHSLYETFSYTFLVDTDQPGYYDNLETDTRTVFNDGAVTGASYYDFTLQKITGTVDYVGDYFYIDFNGDALISDITLDDTLAYHYGGAESYHFHFFDNTSSLSSRVAFVGGSEDHSINLWNNDNSFDNWIAGTTVVNGKEILHIAQDLVPNSHLDIDASFTSTLTLVSIEPYVTIPEPGILVLLLTGCLVLFPAVYISRKRDRISRT
jgi:hypothetical protein